MSEAARLTLRKNLLSVLDLIPPACLESSRDIEHVHRLRVQIRRCDSAIRFYRPLLPAKRADRLKGRLAQLRHAAGPARDLDVLMERISRSEEKGGLIPRASASSQRLLDLMRERRVKSQGEILMASLNFDPQPFRGSIEALVKRTRWRQTNPEPVISDYASVAFTPIVKKFLAAGEKGLRKESKLHRFRIKGKAVRYAMDNLDDVLETSFPRELRKQFSKLQDRLGGINDMEVAAGTFRRMMVRLEVSKAVDAGQKEEFRKLRKLLRQVIREAEESHRKRLVKFNRWWSQKRREALASQFSHSVCAMGNHH